MSDFTRCHFDNCEEWFKTDESLSFDNPDRIYCAYHGGKRESKMPVIPHRRCIHLDENGLQCDIYFPADTNDKLCPAHRVIASVGTRNGENEEQKIRYIDLVNDQRKYCYTFLDGKEQNQDKTLIFEFKDDEEGTVFEKLDRHYAFLESVLADIRARMQSTRAVKVEHLEKLTEEERKELRKIKIDKAVKTSDKKSSPSVKKDPIAHLMTKNNMSKSDAQSLLTMDADELIAKFKALKESRKENNL